MLMFISCGAITNTSQSSFISTLNIWLALCIVLSSANTIPTKPATTLAVNDFQHILDNCIAKCPFQSTVEGMANDLWCDEACSIEHCINGCRQWRKALRSSCYTHCNFTQGHGQRGQALYCLMGCNLAVTSYIAEVKTLMGKIPAPVPVTSTITSSSVTLRCGWSKWASAFEWPVATSAITSHAYRNNNNNSNASMASISLQWRHVQPGMGGTWEAVSSVSRDDQWREVTVKELHPYTSYRFRLVAVLASDREILTSEESSTVTTLPHGLPSSSPLNLQAVALDVNRISISWDPPLFPNGPLISYSLTIKEAFPRGPQVYPGFQDIVGTNRPRSYVFVHLSPNTSYAISVSARNAEGQGPESKLEATTLPVEKVSSSPEPFILIVVDNRFIFRHAPGLIHYEELPIHESPMNAITALAVHARQGALFIADDHDRVFELSLNPNGKSDVRLSWQVSDDTIVSIKWLSVDWLSDRLYMLLQISDSGSSSGGGFSWQIARSKLNGREFTHVVTDIVQKPFQIEVDPFNGFLIWGVKDGPSSGLYQVDLADLTNQPLSAVANETQIKRILGSQEVVAFTIDPANARVFAKVMDSTGKTTISAVPYGGESSGPTTTVRHLTALEENVSSLAYLDEVFYWIQDGHSFYEEVDTVGNLYVNNLAPMAESRHTALVVCDIKSQPIPIPLTPIRQLQALFGSNSAHIKWDAPAPVAQRGRGAWQNWSYRMQIEDMESGASVFRDGFTGTEMDVDGLRPNTTYTITVQPSSNAGHGVSTCAFFVGKTLPDGNRTIYWSSGGAIHKSSPIGKDVVAFVDISQHNTGPVEIISMAHMADWIYVVTNCSRMYKIDLRLRNIIRLENIEAVSVATEPLGRKIYWASSKRLTIGRSLHDGTHSEWLPIIGIATSLAIHSTKGKLMWCTGHSIEGSLLNADERNTYWSSGLRSGNQAIGMTLDYDHDDIYWMVLQLDGVSFLYKANIDSPQSTSRVSQVGHWPARGPIQYMSDRLIWLQELSTMIAISDLNGTNSYLLGSPRQRRVSSFLIVDDTQYKVPANWTVIPNSVNASSVAVSSSANGSLLVTWSPVTNVNYGQLRYDIRVSTPEDNGTAVTTSAAYQLPSEWKTPPYTEMYISIRAFTVWGSAAASDARRRTPPSTPGVPLSPRTFVSFIRDEVTNSQTGLLVDFRWSPPVKSNGELQGYKVECWHEKNGTKRDACLEDSVVASTVTDYSTRTLLPNETYYFTVQAFTQVGYGPKTAPVVTSTAKETPVPQLLVFTSNALWLSDLDKHKSLNKSLARGISSIQSPPVALAFINQERHLYWIDSHGDLYSHELGTHLMRKIFRLNGTGNSLAVDWISRNIYWSQVDTSMGGSSIYRLDLEGDPEEPFRASLVLHDRNNVAKLVEVDPFTSRIIWMSVSKNGTGTLMISDVNGRNSRRLFGNQEACSGAAGFATDIQSPPSALGSSVTAVDWSNAQQPRLMWISAVNEDVWSSDWLGCHSVAELNASELRRTGGWPPSSLTVDRFYFYWSNDSEGRVYKMRRSYPAMDHKAKYTDPSASVNSASAFTSRRDVSAEQVADVRKIATLGTNSQPLPSQECLAPLAAAYVVQLINVTDNSVTLAMPVPQRPIECERMTMAPVRYHIYYGPTEECFKNFSLCLVQKSNQDQVILRNLSPFTRYSVRVRLTNFYQSSDYSMPVGEAVQFSTEPGAPFKPKGLSVTALSPQTVRVQWNRPSALNGPTVSYRVFWKQQASSSPPRSLTEDYSKEFDGNADVTDEPYFMDVRSLLANTNYTFWVQAGSVNNKWNSSDVVTASTYANPLSMVLTNVSSNFISFEWTSPDDSTIRRHLVEISVTSQNKWRLLTDWVPTYANHLYYFSAENLTSLTSYSFRLRLEYSPYETQFIWPADEAFVAQTKGNAPAQPRSPQAKKSPDNLVELWWGPTPTNGYPILYYILEMKTIDEVVSASQNTDGMHPKLSSSPALRWIPIYNGSDHFYVAHNLTVGTKYQFRVQAFNEMGASEHSSPSSILQMDNLIREGTPNSVNMVLSVSISALIAFCSLMTLLLFYACRRPQLLGKKSSGEISVHPVTGSEMTDLATLRELPQRESFVQQNNALYGVGIGDCDLDQELALLPHIRFEDLGITKFLGRGAFGEVFEGRINQLPGSNQTITRVAVKTLRKGATEQEKSDFLKEALLMSHFKHQHIIRLLGVCLDADPNFILLELMEGGDLLSYLRNNRPLPSLPPQSVDPSPFSPLGLLDLVSMCVDVAKGCCYLEELHFVHRDLAARNCLVSSLDPRSRVVKIGDFGLARDIYRNDYYRKEGEGLLPVRWMAPESLMDGVFTSQTDVWSFGVLLWEILTLGQQPYPARTNLQVLDFVRTGGRLDRPPNCPDSLFSLMMCCWGYDPAVRPSFTQCLSDLICLQEKLKNSPFTAVHNDHYVGSPADISARTWEADHTSSSESCVYLEQHVLEQPEALYANELAAVLNGFVSPICTRTSGLERSSSAHHPSKYRTARGHSCVVRSNSISSGAPSAFTGRNDRYLELVNESALTARTGGNTRNVSHEMSLKAKPLYSSVVRDSVVPPSSNNSSQTDLSDITDESCVANSPTPLCESRNCMASAKPTKTSD